MKIKKIVSSIRLGWKKLGLSSPKRNGFGAPLTGVSDKYGKKPHGKNFWIDLVKKKLQFLFILKKKKSYLSRAEKRKIIKIRATKIIASVSICLLVVIGLKKPVENLVSSIELFHIKEIAVSGCQKTDVADLKTMAGVDYNTSMFLVDPERVESALVGHPWVKSAKVERQWPNSISIVVVEHVAEALMVSGPENGGKFCYINRDGESITPVQAGEDIDFPVITGANLLSESEKNIALKDASTFLKLIGSNDPNLPEQSVSEIHLDREKGMIVHLVEFPFPIYFGKGEVKKKYKQLRKVLAVLFKKRNRNMGIGQIDYIRIDYLENKVLIARTESG